MHSSYKIFEEDCISKIAYVWVGIITFQMIQNLVHNIFYSILLNTIFGLKNIIFFAFSINNDKNVEKLLMIRILDFYYSI